MRQFVREYSHRCGNTGNEVCPKCRSNSKTVCEIVNSVAHDDHPGNGLTLAVGRIHVGQTVTRVCFDCSIVLYVCHIGCCLHFYFFRSRFLDCLCTVNHFFQNKEGESRHKHG
uniref:Uncharacterized protein n=1 Tax=Cacopsylla melanoneura TaxID=428564 RepID=A0A8D8WSZ2_9HEMI